MKKLNTLQYRYHIAIAVAILLLAACSTSEKLYNKAKGKNQVKVAQLWSNDWPCITTPQDTVRRTDTIVDIITVDCPDTTAYGPDSVIIRIPVKVQVPVTRIKETTTITIRVRETSREYVADSKAREAITKAEKWQRKAENRNTVIMWLVIAMALSIIGNIIMIRR